MTWLTYVLLLTGLLWMLVIDAAWAYAQNQRPRVPAWGFVVGLCVLTLLMRLPLTLSNQFRNVDEAQIITQALTLWRVDGVFWRSVDGTTSGPLSSYLLTLPLALGASQLDYMAARLVSAGLLVLAFGFSYGAVRLLFGEIIARLSLIPTAVVLAFTDYNHFDYYTSEQPCVAVISGMAYGLAWQQQHRRLRIGYLFGIGLGGGLVWLIKLQSAPIAAGLLGLALLQIWAFGEKRRWWAGVVLVVSTALVPGFFVLLLSKFGVLTDAYELYFQSNLIYAGEASWKRYVPLSWIRSSIHFYLVVRHFWLALAFPVAAWGWHLYQNRRTAARRFTAPPGILLGLGVVVYAAAFAIDRPHRPYANYLFFWFLPTSPLLWGGLLNELNPTRMGYRLVALSGLVGLLFASLIQAPATARGLRGIRPTPFVTWKTQPLGQHRAGTTAMALLKPGETMLVWGWRPQFYVELQVPQGAMLNHMDQLANEQGAAYFPRFMESLRMRHPAVILDAAGPASWFYIDRNRYRLERYPELNRWVQDQYEYKGEVDQVRIWYHRPLVSAGR